MLLVRNKMLVSSKARMVQSSKVGISPNKGISDSIIRKELQVGHNSSLVGVRDQTKVDSSNNNSSRPRAPTCSIRNNR